MPLSPDIRKQIDELPTEGQQLSDEVAVGILVRHRFAREFLCGLLAQSDQLPIEDRGRLQSMQQLVEKDVPFLLRLIAS